MSYMKKMYLINENDYTQWNLNFKKHLEFDPEKQDDVRMSQYRTKFFENKIEQKAHDDSEWNKLGNHLTPILQSSIIPDSSKQEEITIYDLIDTKIPKDLRLRTLKLINILKEFPSVTVTP